MSQENVELVRRMYEGAPEIESLLAAGEDLAGHPWLSFPLFDLAVLLDGMIGHATGYLDRERAVEAAGVAD
jgi:hypothetical protein